MRGLVPRLSGATFPQPFSYLEQAAGSGANFRGAIAMFKTYAVALASAAVAILISLSTPGAAVPRTEVPSFDLPAVSSIAARRCPACTILCRKGFVCRCNQCIRQGGKCRPQNVMCTKGSVWKCNRCVRAEGQCHPQNVMCKKGYH